MLAKLPKFDCDWAKTQFIWGLHQRVAELVTIADLGDLHVAINQAEKIEMARNFAASGQQGQKQGNPNRGRGGFMRRHGKFNVVQLQVPNTTRIKLLSMQECRQDNRSLVDMVLVPWEEINMANVMVGDAWHINVLPLQEEDEDVCMEDAEA